MMRLEAAVGVLAGPLTWNDATRAVVDQASTLVAADGGLDHLFRLGVRPQALLGDMDSVSSEALAWAQDLPQLTFPVRKDQTDGQILLSHLLTPQDTPVVLLGGLGMGRSDHMLGLLMACVHRVVAPIWLTDGVEWWCVARGPYTWQLADVPADTNVSFVPMSQVQGYTTRDLDYEVEAVELSFGSTRAISNRRLAELPCPTVSFDSGVGVLCLTPDDR